jgi:hypothetical protein
MNNNSTIYDWIVVGGGISGISVAEILCRGGKSVLLIEKNQKLASETSKVFHEWLHSGSLYSLTPDRLLTLRYLLGATDDLLEYYDSFSRMNLKPTERGIDVVGDGWFNNQNIEYRYKVHKFNPIWSSLVSRSINIIDLLNNHDWLRRRAGSEYGDSKVKFSYWFNHIFKQIKSDSSFFTKTSPDITINSRVLIPDILSSALSNGLSVLTGKEVVGVDEKEDFVFVNTKNEVYQSKNVVICSPDSISKFLNIPIKIGYAPIAVVENVPEEESSFVELDYNIRKCINLIKKGNGIAQAGGVTLDKKEDVDSYLSYIISQHKKRNPGIEVVDTYVGLKKELVQKGENRNYLYHINQNSSKVWSIVLGKFSLAFSMAPEFYRKIYKENPPKVVSELLADSNNDLVSKTSWEEIVNNSRR